MVVSKKKKKVNTRFPERIVFHDPGLTVPFKSFSARVVKAMLQIKDNSNFIKDKDRGVQIKDGWQPYTVNFGYKRSAGTSLISLL